MQRIFTQLDKRGRNLKLGRGGPAVSRRWGALFEREIGGMSKQSFPRDLSIASPLGAWLRSK